MFERLKKLRPFFSRRDQLEYGGLLALMGVGSLLEIVGIGVVPAFISTLAAPEKVRDYPGVEPVLIRLGIDTGQELVIWGAVGVVLVFTVRAAFLIFLKHLRISLTERHRVRLARLLFTRYMQAPYEFHLGRNSAELLRNVDTETKNITRGFINPFLQLVLNGMMTVCIGALLVVTTPWAALGAVVAVGGGAWLFIRTVRAKMARYGQKARTERRKAIQAVQQGLGGFRDARVLGVEDALVADFHESVARYADLERYKKFMRELGNPLLEYVAVVGLMTLVLVMVLVETDLAAMVPMLGLFGAAIVRLRATVGTITNSINTLQYNKAAVDPVVRDLAELGRLDHRLRSLDERTGADDSSTGDDSSISLERELRFEDVSFAYSDGDEPALRDLDLTIRRGESVGLVGATGSGKTTLVNLILGLLRPQEGRILVDGEPVQNDIRGWQAQLGYIPQSIYLLDDTIRRNVAFGRREDEIDDERVWNALFAAQIGSFVMDHLSEGINTMVGENGVRLSGGQRQRIGLARAIYADPDVLVMDEATSDLDNETENQVMEALDDLKQDRTFVMIAHRLSTVQNCDRLFFLKDGAIAARGTFEELRRTHADFRRMAEVKP